MSGRTRRLHNSSPRAAAQPRNLPSLGGELGSAILAFDWSSTHLGAIDRWPPALRVLLSTILDSPLPVYLAWGPHLVQMYNDAFARVLGAADHPAALGQPAREYFRNRWKTLGPPFEAVLADRGPVVMEDAELTALVRGGQQTGVLTFAYSAARDERGSPRGVLITAFERSPTTKNGENISLLRELASEAVEAARLSRADAQRKAEQLHSATAEMESQAQELRAASEELRTMNERLSLSETRLRIANAAAVVGTWEADTGTGTLRCDDRCRSIMALPAEGEITLSDFLMAVHPDDQESIRSMVSHAITTARARDDVTLDTQFRVMDQDAQTRWVWMIGRSLSAGSHDGNAPANLFGTALDITVRKQAEEALKDEAQIIRTLQRVGTALASELDLATLIQTVTDEATILTGAHVGAFVYNVRNEEGEAYNLYTIAGAPRESFSGFPLPRLSRVFEPTFRSSAIIRSDDITVDERFLRAATAGSTAETQLNVRSYLAVPVVSRSGEVLGGLFFGHEARGMFAEAQERLASGVAGWAAVAIDNARLYEAERAARREADAARMEAEQANHAKTDFLATMSHELRTPLNAIAGYVTLLEMEIRGPITEQQREDLRRIQRSQKHLLSLINDVLNFAKLEAGQVELEITDIELKRLLVEVQELLQPEMRAKGLSYTQVECDPAEMVRADREKLRQVLLNLITNAVKFTDPPGEVSVRCTAVETNVKIEVRDTGRGIERDKLPTIFEPFVQINRHLTPATEQGVGLGLAISKELALAMDGDLTAESEAGKGSVFSLQLPRARRAKE